MAKKEILNKEMFRERALVIKWYLYDFFVDGYLDKKSFNAIESLLPTINEYEKGKV